MYCADIEGAQPKEPIAAMTKSYSSLRNDDIEGTLPKKHYCKTERKSLSLCTQDILGATSTVSIEKFKRNSSRNPLEHFNEQNPLGDQGKL